jgi:drug/metabolite transporter (DMT)-like permease
VGRFFGQLLGAVLALAGIIWIGQGIGLIRGSFMTGSALWAVIGALCLIAGAYILYRSMRSKR